MAQILFFGSGTTQGVGDPQGGWVDRFKRELHGKMYGTREGNWHEVFNLGVVGNSSAQILERLPAELPSRQWAGQPLIVVFALGLDDTRAQESPTNYVSSPQQYYANLQSIIEFVKPYTMDILFLGLTPVDDAKTRPTFDHSYLTSQRVKEFDDAMTQAAHAAKLPKLQLYDTMLAEDWRAMLLDDGLHLNSAGHEWIYQRARLPILELVKFAEQQMKK